MFAFGAARRRRRPGLTAMIDVVFLLLIFFMLASRFGTQGSLSLTLPGGSPEAADWSGPPRLVQIGRDSLRLNGVETAPEALPRSLGALLEAPADPVILLPGPDVDLQGLVRVMEALRQAGLTTLILAGP